MSAISGRLTGCMYAIIASVSMEAVDNSLSSSATNMASSTGPHFALVRNVQPPANCTNPKPRFLSGPYSCSSSESAALNCSASTGRTCETAAVSVSTAIGFPEAKSNASTSLLRPLSVGVSGSRLDSCICPLRSYTDISEQILLLGADLASSHQVQNGQESQSLDQRFFAAKGGIKRQGAFGRQKPPHNRDALGNCDLGARQMAGIWLPSRYQ